MRVKVDGLDGGSEELEIDLNLENLTMRESVRLEEILGESKFDALMAGQLDEAAMSRPSFIRAMLFVKLKTQRPELEIDQFDVELEEFTQALEGSVPKADEPSSG